MNLLIRGLILTVLQGLIVFSLAAKYQIDREKLPREWMKAAPFDPNLPIRGRYVRLRLVDHPKYADAPMAYFIPEHVPDPSVRAVGEELWVEVTVPENGPPRPIRLGVKKSGVLTPLQLN